MSERSVDNPPPPRVTTAGESGVPGRLWRRAAAALERRPWLAWMALALIGAALLLPGIGSHGLWDPWEMRTAHVARTVAGPTRLLVVESPEDADTPFPATKALQAAAGAEAEVEILGPPSVLPDQQVKRQKFTGALVRNHSASALSREVFHAVVLDARLWASALENDDAGLPSEDTQDIAEELEEIAQANGGIEIAVWWPGAAFSESELRSALRRARIVSAYKNWSTKLGGLDPLDAAALDSANAELAGDPLFEAPEFAFLTGDAASAPWADWLSGLPSPWARVQFKRDSVTRSLPPLDAWLLAISYSISGFSEAASRIPFALVALFGALAFALLARRIVGLHVAWMAGFITLTAPLYFAQGRYAAGEITVSVALALFVIGYARTVLAPAERRADLVSWATMLGAALLAFLADGLFGFVTPLLVLGGYVAVSGDWRRRAWIPAAALAVTLALASFWVLGADDWSIAHHFRFTRRLFTDGPTDTARTFDFLLRQIGFGLLPWSVFFPFGLAWLAVRFSQTKDGGADDPRLPVSEVRIAVFAFLFASLPLALAMLTASELNHLVFAGAPGVALAVALMLVPRAHSEPPRLDRLAAFAAFCLLLVILRETKKYGDAPFSFLTLDPPFSKDEGAALAFPAEYVSPRPYRYVGLLGLLALMNSYARLGTQLTRFLRWAARPATLWFLGAVALLALGGVWLAGAAGAYDALRSSAVVRALGQTPASFTARALTRPEQLGFLVALGVLIAAAILGGTAAGRSFWARRPATIQSLAAKVGRIAGRLGLGRWSVAAAIVFTLGSALLLSSLVHLPRPDGFGIGSAFADPVTWLLVALTVFAIAGRAIAAKWKSARWAREAPIWAPPLMGLGLTLAYVGIRISKELWRVMPEQWVLTLLLAVVASVFLLIRLPRRPAPLLAAAAGTWLAYVGGALAPLVGRWPELYALVPGNNPVADPMPRAFWGAPAPFAAYGLVGVALVASLAYAWRKRRAARISAPAAPPRWKRWAARAEGALRWTERPAVATWAFSLVAFAMAILYSHRLVATMSYHVSQKHILDTYRDAASDPEASPLFSHGNFGGGDADYNFYTNNVPAVANRQTALEMLARQTDVSAPVRRGTSPAVMLQGYSSANDVNNDGKRDWKTAAGLAETVDGSVVTDTDQQWQTDQWKGYLLIGARKRTWPIESNSATTVTVQGTPTLEEHGGLFAFAIDHPDAPNHEATLQTKSRSFFMLPKKELSELNHAFRKLTDGRHIPVVDDRSSRMVLAASWLAAGETSSNIFDAHTYTQAEFETLDMVRPVSAQFGDKTGPKLEVIGYYLDDYSVRPRNNFRLHTFFKVLAPLPKSYKIFLHVDKQGSSHRIHGDHFILNQAAEGEESDKCVGCYLTTHWMKDDIIEDVFEHEVPLGSPSGLHDMWFGLYQDGGDGKRLEVLEFDKNTVKHDGENRINLGPLRVQ